MSRGLQGYTPLNAFLTMLIGLWVTTHSAPLTIICDSVIRIACYIVQPLQLRHYIHQITMHILTPAVSH